MNICNGLQRLCKDSIPIRFRFDSGSNPVGFRFDSTTQFLPNSYSIPPFILGQDKLFALLDLGK